MNSLIARLIATHRRINREIRRELRHRVPDHFRLVSLKKQRLAIKDQLYRHSPEPGSLRRSARAVFAGLRGKRSVTAQAGS